VKRDSQRQGLAAVSEQQELSLKA